MYIIYIFRVINVNYIFKILFLIIYHFYLNTMEKINNKDFILPTQQKIIEEHKLFSQFHKTYHVYNYIKKILHTEIISDEKKKLANILLINSNPSLEKLSYAWNIYNNIKKLSYSNPLLHIALLQKNGKNTADNLSIEKLPDAIKKHSNLINDQKKLLNKCLLINKEELQCIHNCNTVDNCYDINRQIKQSIYTSSSFELELFFLEGLQFECNTERLPHIISYLEKEFNLAVNSFYVNTNNFSLKKENKGKGLRYVYNFEFYNNNTKKSLYIKNFIDDIKIHYNLNEQNNTIIITDISLCSHTPFENLHHTIKKHLLSK
jgi:hypothetical protein